jgi:hypothetical protein
MTGQGEKMEREGNPLDDEDTGDVYESAFQNMSHAFNKESSIQGLKEMLLGLKQQFTLNDERQEQTNMEEGEEEEQNVEKEGGQGTDACADG